MSLRNNVVLGWLGRRALDWGGWIGVITTAGLGIYNGLSKSDQAAVQQLLTGHWQDVTLGSLVPLIILVVSQVMSFRATTKPQVVTSEGQKTSLSTIAKGDPHAATYIEAKAETAAAAKPDGRIIAGLKRVFGNK